MIKVRKVHWAYLKTATPRAMCGEENRPQLTHDQAAVTCGRCRKLLGIPPYVVPLPKEYRQLKPPSRDAVDSLISRAFVENDARLGELCTKARVVLTIYEAPGAGETVQRECAENMADLLRGFISALGRAD